MAERIAVLVENDFHDIEFWYPFYRLQEAGYEPIIVAPAAPKVYRGTVSYTHLDVYKRQSCMFGGHRSQRVITSRGFYYCG